MKEKAKVEEEVKAKSDDNGKEGEQAKGVPGFWLTIFKNVEMLAEMVQASSVNYRSMSTTHIQGDFFNWPPPKNHKSKKN